MRALGDAACFVWLILGPITGCARASAPDPRAALAAYTNAVAQKDAEGLYAMLDERSRRELRSDDVRRMLTDGRGDLLEKARAMSDPSASLVVSATVTYADGEDAALDLDRDGFRIRAVDALPGGGKSPAQALDQLRRVLARRSYAGFVRLLSPATKSAIERDLRTVVEGLAHPERLRIRVNGDTAEVEVLGGHSVRLRRDGGLWKVEDLD